LRGASRVFEIVSSFFQLSQPSPSWYSGRLWLLRIGYYKLFREKETADDWIWIIGVSRQGHIIQSVQVRPGIKGSIPVAWEAPWRESKMVKPSDKLFRKEIMQGCRPQRTVNADVASSQSNPVAETVDNARRQQGSFEKSPIRRFSPAGYQRWHVAKDCVSTGEALGVRRRNLVEEADPITLNGKWVRRHQGGGLGRSTVDRCAAKRTGRKGPRPMFVPFAGNEAGAR
jgi:hypothetical protein